MHCLEAFFLMDHLEIGKMIDVLVNIESHPSFLSRMLYASLEMSF